MAKTPPAGEDAAFPAPTNAIGEASIRVRLQGKTDAPLVIVAGGISSHRFVAGEGGWWPSMVGDGAGIDLNRYRVMGFDFAPSEDRRAAVTPDLQARLIVGALDGLGVKRAHGFVGASYGGMVGLALGAIAPDRVERLCIISAAHKPAALARAWRGVQRRVVEFAMAQGSPQEGLALARQLAMITYRSGEEFATRFDDVLDADGHSELDRYLIARGEAFTSIATAQRWLSLSEAIDRFSVAPEDIAVPTTVVACPTDQIAPLADMEEMARRLPRCAGFHLLPSLCGHDAFLKEPDRLTPILRAALEDKAQ